MADSRNIRTINYAKRNIRHSDIQICDSVGFSQFKARFRGTEMLLIKPRIV